MMQHGHTAGAEVDLNIAVRSLITMAAPERSDEIADLWSRYSPSFDVASDTGRFHMEAGPFGLVLLTPRSMCISWLLVHEAWATLDCYSTMLWMLNPFLSSESVRASFGRWLHAPADQVDVENQLDDIAQKVDELRAGVDLGDFEWPTTVPILSTDRPQEASRAAPYDLACLSLAIMFLHEVRHVMEQDEAEEQLSSIEREHRCDAFAQDFLMEHLSSYAQREGYPESKVASKRAIALGIWCYTIHRIVGEHESESHPPPSARLRRMLLALELPSYDKFWIVMASLLVNQLRASNHLPASVSSTSLSDLVWELLEIVADIEGS